MATWVVNSYSYPNPFRESQQAQGSWEMFKSFVEQPKYDSVKKFWEDHATRPVSSHAVESWKATFEEFGLLFVLTGDDNVIITPGGHQLMAAAEARDEREFAWVGLNLLLRYPLRGEAGRRTGGSEFGRSDLLLYWFLHAALIELNGFWQQELFRVLAHVFNRTDAQPASELVRQLRGGHADINRFPDPSAGKSGGVYNALNQVMVHGSLSHMLFTSSKKESRYFANTAENWWNLRDEFRDLVELALGVQTQPLPKDCASQASLLQRMPAAPNFSEEIRYFDYAGAPVTALTVAQAQAQAPPAPRFDYGGEKVFLLRAGRHFTRLDADNIVGPVHALCVIAEEQRVLLSDELGYTYIVEHKQLAIDEVRMRLRQARPVIDPAYAATLFEEI